MEKIKTICKCGNRLEVNVGDSIQDGELRWYLSYQCNKCGNTIEMDGRGIDDFPCEIRAEIIKKSGEWGIIIEGSISKVKFILNKMLGNSFINLSNTDFKYIITGTRSEMEWIKNKLIEKNIETSYIKISQL